MRRNRCVIFLLVYLQVLSLYPVYGEEYVSVSVEDMTRLKKSLKLLESHTLCLKMEISNYEGLTQDLRTLLENMREDLQKEKQESQNWRVLSNDLRVQVEEQTLQLRIWGTSYENLNKSLRDIERDKKTYKILFMVVTPLAIIASALIAGFATYTVVTM